MIVSRIGTNRCIHLLIMQEKRPNKVLGYRQDMYGEPVQTLIGPCTDDRCVVFTLSSGESSVILPRDSQLMNEPFLPCNDPVNEKIFRKMKQHPAVYVKYYKILNARIPD